MAVAHSAREVWFLLSSGASRSPVRRNFYWTFAGNVMNAAAQWALIVLLARLGSPTIVGQYTLGLAITSPIFTLASLNLRSLQATDMTAQFRFADYLGIRLISMGLAVAASLVVLAVTDYSFETTMVVAALAWQKAIDGVSEAIYGRWHQREQMDRIAQSMMLRGTASTLLLSAVVWRTHSGVWGVLSLAAVSLSVLVAFDLAQLDLRNRVRVPALGAVWNNLWELARVAGPLGFAPMLVALNAYQSRYWLAYYHAESDIGVYSALAYVTVAANLVVVALAQAAGPAMTRAYFSDNRREFLAGALRLGALGLALGAGGIVLTLLWGGEAMTLFYGPRYAAHSDSLRWLMLAGAFSYLASCTGYTLTAARRFLAQVPILCTAGLSIAVASAMLVPAHGIRGAAIAQAIGSAVQLLLNVAKVATLFRR